MDVENEPLSSVFAVRITKGLEQLCKRNSKSAGKLQNYLSKQIWSPVDRQSILDILSDLFVEFYCTEDVCWSFRFLILEIICRAEKKLLSQTDRPIQYLTIALSKALTICPNLKGLAAEILKKYGLFPKKDTTGEPKEKKRKKDNRDQKVLELELCQAAWRYSKHLLEFSTFLELDEVLPFLKHHNNDIRWFSLLTVAEITGMSTVQKEAFRSRLFSTEDGVQLAIRHNEIGSKGSLGDLYDWESCDKPQKYTRHALLAEDLGESVISIEGILLPKLSSFRSDEQRLVQVSSTKSNLRNLALAVSSNQPALLQGPVGSGKTTLVEELARLTGRCGPPNLIKLQLGDQTDSKALLGTYRCTDVPGEFVWQPGVLTQAVTEGHWLLLEDIDYAPMDVLSVLLPLLETHTLCLPGHGDSIQASPGFQVFFTQRILETGSGWHKQHYSNSAILSKLWRQINVEPLTRQELAQVIQVKYPQLLTVVDRILDIYFMFAGGKHSTSSENEYSADLSVFKVISNEGRLISTRDLMTWCRRIATGFDVSSPESAVMVFQNALDCFCACVSNPEKRAAIAEAIATKLNINNNKAEFYCCKYKPNVEITPSSFSIGRVCLQKDQVTKTTKYRVPSFAFTRQSSVLLERVAVCVTDNEPVLLVGETGTGKTSSVQYLAQQLGHELRVINMNQQSDSSDLLGGYKPVDVSHVIRPFKDDFELLFCQTFSRNQNSKFLQHIQECFTKRRWPDLFSLIEHTQRAAVKKCFSDVDSLKLWRENQEKLQHLKLQVQQTQKALAFTFIEGTLVKALKAGDWVLLDEINLATAETLECLSGLLESTSGSVLLSERGDSEPIIRHENFRLFACMNPATDVGKKDLPLGIRNRFTELYVDDVLTPSDLTILAGEYLRGLSLSSTQVDGIVKFYLAVKKEAERKLTDGTGHKPHFSLRTLCRALRYAAKNPCIQVTRSLYEGFCLSFLTQLDRCSHPVVQQLICQHILSKLKVKSVLNQDLPEPANGKHLNIEGYWIPVGQMAPSTPEHYILTPSVRANLKDLARIVSAGQHPVLLQGETSVGKTSLIGWLAKTTGHQCVRVNNHEHTDLQEYVGSYTADQHEKLTFKEGVLVDAMRKGHWIILDELNLAPSDVLEALNRLLDDNRELFIPETQETVRAHPKFMLFATQNPPGQYGGRKILSRAFRNRFIELHFDEIPSKELETILHKRCDLPLSYGRRLVAVMLELQIRRRGSRVFAGKQGFMTLRDLFRWANRYHSDDDVTKKKFYDWDQHMADHGYMLLAGRVRKAEEGELVREVIQKHLKRNVDPHTLYSLTDKTSTTTVTLLKSLLNGKAEGFEHIVWTYSTRRLAVLVGQAITYKEPLLLVGETGCGKTTVCQFLAALKSTGLQSINCHMHSESADFLGGLRPIRSRSELSDGDQRLFEWVDGPLVLAMRQGHMFLIDEISLADDSVLERLNSVLEPERSLLMAEKGGSDGIGKDVEHIIAKDDFQVFATMNPGGDYGKKELSPALRNRFTEIWCTQVTEREDLIAIIEHNLDKGLQLCNQEDCSTGIGRAMVDFVQWFINNDFGKRCTVSIRDYLSWVNFMNVCGRPSDDLETSDQLGNVGLDPAMAYIHGACLVFLDALGTGVSHQTGHHDDNVIKQICLTYLIKQVNDLTGLKYSLSTLGLLHKSSMPNENAVISDCQTFSIPPFSIQKGDMFNGSELQFTLLAPTPCVNGQRVLRALQLNRPILLEGSPGVGKTSLVTALAKASGRQLVRINLSEQTDVTDLFGADLPVEGAKGGVFAWRDGPLLKALKDGHWIVLDELNLASQSVLEGLNACLDHRAEVFIPELARTFHIKHNETRIFACQNPLNQGGGRKGLPRSFLNRFTQVYIEPLSHTDLIFISSTMYPAIPKQHLSQMVEFNSKLHQSVMEEGQWGQRGAPWEFNLRDIFRWCDIMVNDQEPGHYNIGQHVFLLYRDRMRTEEDKRKVFELFQSVCPELHPPYTPAGVVKVTPNHIQIYQSFLPREITQQQLSNQTQDHLYLLHHSLPPLETLMKCVEMKWMAILVGPQSSGKTSLVRTLSQLCGSSLHVLAMNSSMDTTELLGGFEQANLSRHIEEVGKKLEDLVRQFCIRQLVNFSEDEGLKPTCHIWKLWQHFVNIATKGKQCSNLAELECMKGQIKLLRCLVDYLETHFNEADKVKDVLHKCSIDLSNIGERLEITSRQSGTFEWIDSLLVRALQTGDWLLIDNVNFCSASVLDRLNALLEPHGVLSVNERGVVDGQVPVIKPHPNFRLFMSMDPKFGEISRAMRNRGVEIYLLGEDEGGCFDDMDIKTVLHGMGLSERKVTDWLISFHQDVRKALIGQEKPIIQDLFNVAVLTKQEVDKGVKLTEALKNSCSSIYVKNIKTTASRKNISVLLDEKFQQLEGCLRDNCSKSELPELCVDPVPISVEDYRQNPTLATVIKHSTLLFQAWNWLNGLLVNRDSGSMEDDISKGLCLLKYGGQIYLEQMSFNDSQLAISWIQDFERKSKRALGILVMSHGISEMEATIFGEDFFSNFVTVLQSLFNSPTAQEYVTFIKSLSPDVCVVLTDESCDIRWNTQALGRLLRQISKSEGSESAQSVKTLIEFYNNRLYLVQLLLEKQIREDTWRKQVNPRDKSPLAISYLFHQGHQGWVSLENPVLHHLYPFFTLVFDFLQSTLPDITHLSDHKLQQVLLSCQWFFRLLEICRLRPKSGFSSLLPRLHLHWNWFFSKTLPAFTSFSTNGLTESLTSAVTVVNSLLGQDNTRSKLFLKVWRRYGHAQRYRNRDEAHLHDILQTILTKLSAIEQATETVSMATKMTITVCDKLLTTQYDLDEIQIELQKIQCLLDTGSLSNEEPMEIEDQPEPSNLTQPANQIQQKSKPLFEFIAVLSEMFLIGQAIQWESQPNMNELADFSLQHCKSDPRFLSLIKHLNGTIDYEKHRQLSVTSLLLSLQNLWQGILGTDPMKSLCSNVPDTNIISESSPNMMNLGPGVLQLSPLTYITHNLLALNLKSEMKSSQSMTICLGEFTETVKMLESNSQLLWIHSPVLASPNFDLCHVEGRKAILLLARLFECLTVFLSPDNSSLWLSYIQQLKSQTESLSTDFQETIVNIIQSSLSTTLDKLVTDILLRCVESADHLTTSPSLVTMGTLWVYLGLVQSMLLAPVGPVDPIVKQQIKLQYINQELSEIDEELSARDLNQKMLTGLSLDKTRSDLLHPRVKALISRQGQLESMRLKLDCQQCFRPEPPKFDGMIKDVKNLQGTNGDPVVILSLLDSLVNVQNDPRPDLRSLKEEIVWQASLEKFIKLSWERYPGYQDLLEPFLLGVHQMRFGMRTVSQYVRVQHQRAMLETQIPKSIQFSRETWLEDVLITLCKFPYISKQTPNLSSMADSLSSPHILTLIQLLCDLDDHSHNSQSVSRLLLGALQFLYQAAVSCNTLSEDILITLFNLLNAFLAMWRERESKKRLKDEEESSLYRFKTITYGDGLTEDERVEQDFRASFPSYEKDFGDVIDKNELGDGEKKMADDGNEKLQKEISEIGISEEEMIQVCKTHQDIFSCLTQSDWILNRPMNDIVSDDLQPILSCYQIAADLGKKTVDRLNYGLDKKLVGSHILAMVSLQKISKEVIGQALDGPYDIYHDSNVAEVSKCRPLLERFRTRVRELQLEWPDHPTLKQLVIIIGRILSFSVTSPLMKFLSGLELLLYKSQDWESNAAKFVSLTSHIQEVSEMIVEWRKLELSCWNKSMEVVLLKMKQKTSKWWFHIYQLLQSVLHNDSQSMDTKEDNNTLQEVVLSLTQFLESSPLGEFSSRIEMIYSFHCQLLYEGQSEKQELLSNVLWNLHQFYNQFLSPVSEELSRQRTPIEKELKGFVKIARWNDINYWALRQTTEKTHRTIHKHMRAFQMVLSQPIKSLLVETDQSALEKAVSWQDIVKVFSGEILQDLSKTKLNSNKIRVLTSNCEGSILEKLATISKRMNAHCQTVTKGNSFSQDVLTLDEFTVEMIEAIEELRGLEVNKDAEKEKQQSEAKNINLRKRKALSDLFKSLAELGLSYRKGLILNKEDLRRECLQMTPVDLHTIMTKLNRESSTLSKLWDGCCHYIYRSMSRRAQYLVALETPSQELGVSNIDRCHGFSEQLMSLLIEKHKETSQLSSCYKQLVDSTATIHTLDDQLLANQNLPPQSQAKSWLNKVRHLFLSTKEGLKQFQIVLQCCPESTSATDVCMSPLQQRLLSASSKMRSGDSQWMEISQYIQEVSSMSQKSYEILNERLNKALLFRTDVNLMSEELKKIRLTVPKLESVAISFNDPITGTPNCLNEVLFYLIDEIKAISETFAQWEQDLSLCPPDTQVTLHSEEKVRNFVEEIVVSIMLAVQHLEKKTEENKNSEVKTEDDCGTLKDKHLTEALVKNLKEDLNLLNYSKITGQLTDIINMIKGDMIGQSCLPLITLCLPVLQQYTTLMEFYLGHVVSTHRVIGKLQSVLLKLFIDLTTKGFCLPAEFSGEIEGGGASQFEDIEGGGLGEGEGTRDVSDQIETEDQLDDTQKAGEKKEEDKGDHPDVESEDNAIEMTDDFDGKMHDLDQDGDGDDSDEGNDEEEKLDKQMGDVDEKGQDKLDEQMWGSDDEEDNQDEDKESKEEDGPGAGKQTESELVAKDDNPDKTEKEGEQENQENNEDEKQQQQHDLEQLDETEYDDNRVDSQTEQSPDDPSEDLDLPDDLHLDEDETGEVGEQDQETEDINEETPVPEVETETGGDNSEENIDKDVDENLPTEEENRESGGEDEAMDTEDNNDDQGDGREEKLEDIDEEGDNEGVCPQDDNDEEVKHKDSQDTGDVEKAPESGETTQGVDQTEQSETAKEKAGSSENNQDESDGVGQSSSQLSEGHEGQTSKRVQSGSTQEKQKQEKRKPGVSDSERTLGSVDEKYKRLTTQQESSEPDKDSNNPSEKSDLYEHRKDSKSSSDVQTLDVATSEQQENQPIPNKDMEEECQPMEEGETIQPDDTSQDKQDLENNKELKSAQLKGKKPEESTGDNPDEDLTDGQRYETSGDHVPTMTVGRGPESTIHTALEHLNLEEGNLDVEKLRAELEERLPEWHQPLSLQTSEDAMEAWFRYEAITSSLSQELCEQLRLVLEPTQATKLRGDYRTGKRLNMRKVIPYIASEFRKDAIWLRRTKPSKRQYQILLAIDDSSSMMDNHSKQLAFESLAVISNALTLLEAGQLGICSFGESVKVLHPFTEQFTSQSGAKILHQFTFEQKKTKIAQLLKEVTGVMMEARSKAPGAVNHSETAQLLLVVSDGRGLFLEGMDVVKKAVRQARAANIFLVFVVIDNPKCKDSILDIKVPSFKGPGQLPEIQSYMDHFPFPYYLILRDINSLPSTLSDALRQWFELVTAADR